MASGGAAPRLLLADALGRLATASTPITVDIIKAVTLGPSTVLTVYTPNLFLGGGYVYLLGQGANSGAGVGGPWPILAVNGNQVTIGGSGQGTFTAGDLACIVAASPVLVQPDATQAAYFPAANNQDTVVLAGAAGTQIRIYGGSFTNQAAVAGVGFGLRDGTTGNWIIQGIGTTIQTIPFNLGGFALPVAHPLWLTSQGAMNVVGSMMLSRY